MSELANHTGPWQRYLSNGPPPSRSMRRLNTDQPNTDQPNAVDESSQPPADPADASQSTIDLDSPDIGLNWKPCGISGRSLKDKFWIVENSRKCADFCKDQLKVIHSVFITNARTRQRDFCAPLRPKNPRQHGPNSTKPFIVKISPPMSFADIAKRTFNIRTPVATKALRQ